MCGWTVSGDDLDLDVCVFVGASGSPLEVIIFLGLAADAVKGESPEDRLGRALGAEGVGVAGGGLRVEGVRGGFSRVGGRGT